MEIVSQLSELVGLRTIASFPRFIYYCYAHQRPTGGQKHTYERVSLLREFGLNAFVYHPVDGFLLSWFEHSLLPIGPTLLSSIVDWEKDIFVVPEDLGLEIRKLPGRKVIFDKNPFLRARALGFSSSDSDPFLDNNILGVFTVSQHSAELLRSYYHKLRVFIVTPHLDESKFRRLSA